MHARSEHVADLLVDIPAGPQPAQALMRERRPCAERHEEDHREHEHADQQRHRAERALGAVVRPWPSEPLEHLSQVFGIHCVEMIFLAAADLSIQPMNFDEAPVALPLVTS